MAEWIEIQIVQSTVHSQMSPLAMAEWIEIVWCAMQSYSRMMSPLAMAEWIEIVITQYPLRSRGLR